MQVFHPWLPWPQFRMTWSRLLWISEVFFYTKMIQDDTGSRGKASTEDGSKPIWPILPIFGGVKLTSRNVNPGCVLMCEITEGTPWSRDPRWLGTSPSTIWIWIWPSWAAKSPGPCRRCRGCEHGHGGRWGHGKLQKGMMKTGGMVIARKVGCQYGHGMSWINSRSGTVWGNDLGLFQQNGKAQPAQRLSTERISGWQNIPIHRAKSLWGSNWQPEPIPMATTFPKNHPFSGPRAIDHWAESLLGSASRRRRRGDTSLVSMFGHGFCGGPGANRCWGWVFLTDLSYGAIISRAISF